MIRCGRIEGWAVALHIGKYTRRGEADSREMDRTKEKCVENDNECRNVCY